VSTIATRQAPPEVAPAPAEPGRQRRWTRLILPLYTWLMILYFSLPILVMIVFGFNDTEGRLNLRWQGFTLKWYRDLFALPALTAALRNSLLIAVISTIITIALGTMIGLALGRYRFRGKGAYDLVIFSAISAPELVLGASLLSLFVTTQFVRGFVTIIIAHVAFSLAFVAVTVRARVLGLDPALEEAAQDLGANPWSTFRKITLPLLAPGIVAAAMLAFALSIDDFVISNFNSGTTVTFPLYVFGVALRGIPVQVNALATMLFAVTTIAIVAVIWQQRRAERMAAVRPEPVGEAEGAPLAPAAAGGKA
jgi:spermidine/putrescine transport system permease protein